MKDINILCPKCKSSEHIAYNFPPIQYYEEDFDYLWCSKCKDYLYSLAHSEASGDFIYIYD